MLSLIHDKRLRHKRYVDGQNAYATDSARHSACQKDQRCRRNVDGDGDRVVWCEQTLTRSPMTATTRVRVVATAAWVRLSAVHGVSTILHSQCLVAFR